MSTKIVRGNDTVQNLSNKAKELWGIVGIMGIFPQNELNKFDWSNTKCAKLFGSSDPFCVGKSQFLLGNFQRCVAVWDGCGPASLERAWKIFVTSPSPSSSSEASQASLIMISWMSSFWETAFGAFQIWIIVQMCLNVQSLAGLQCCLPWRGAKLRDSILVPK